MTPHTHKFWATPFVETGATVVKHQHMKSLYIEPSKY